MDRYDIPLYAALFVFGTIIGSFLNVVIRRIPAGESLVSPPSHCPNCGHKIKPYENIPILSYVLLRGRCSGCRERISPQYPLVEAGGGLIPVLLQLRFGWGWDWVYYAILILLLFTLSVIDLQTLRLPNPITLFGAVVGLGMALLVKDAGLMTILAGAGVGGGLLLLNWGIGRLLFKRDGVGVGDIKLAAMIGLWLGPGYTVQMFFWAIISALFIGGPAAVLKRKGMAWKIPFGPFLALGTLVTILWGDRIWQWYAGFSGLR